jgi:hypothetical protein
MRRTAVTNSHEIRIVVREMAAITSGRRKQGLPLPSSTQSAKGAHFAAMTRILALPEPKPNAAPFSYFVVPYMVPYWT